MSSEYASHPGFAAAESHWRVQIFDPADPADRRALAGLRSCLPSDQQYDRLHEQLIELCEIRHPSMAAADIARLAAAQLRGTAPADYGNWVFFPWSQRLVHILPEAEFKAVRLSRNRNKITVDEQARLERLTIAVVGLSVGQMTAAALATEGIGGTFVLADFDAIGLSNLNRLRAGVHDIGVNKAVATARQLLETNPYLKIVVFADGVHEECIDAFLSGPPAVDLIVEECDDMYVKWRIREAARSRGLPVVMETSDRGMLDIERFDLDGGRPLFHGRAGDLTSMDIRNMSKDAKVALGLQIVGTETVSPRLAASAIEIGTTLKSWPQLASAVMLGAAVNADTVRRIALDEMTESGRYWVDLEQIVGARPPRAADADGDCDIAPVRHAPPRSDEAIPSWLRSVVAKATTAPSGGNIQPWRFLWNGHRLRCMRDPTRSGNLLDFELRATWLALGAVAENAHLAATEEGRSAHWKPFPTDDEPDVAWDMTFDLPRRMDAEPLCAAIERRCTNRRLGIRRHLPEGVGACLSAEARAGGAALQIFDSPAAMSILGDILGQGDRIRFLSRTMHRELMHEMRWTVEDAASSRDGIDLRTLELGFVDTAALRLLRSWRAMDVVARTGGGGSLARFAQRMAACSSAFGVLTVAGTSRSSYLQGGRALQRVWLAATLLGLAFQPITALTYLFMRAEGGADGLSDSEVRELRRLRREYLSVVAVPPGHGELLFFRLAIGDAPSERSLRRPLEEVLAWG